ncbi:TonB family C-terminal domain-containing protein [Ruegeria intermedia]|uniref:TonB family C-terminal domain-containing protein n=1 Tax=Ruegeria intermedia TaxID=996115 RepID=A0A1M5B484_9RHOB|nr:TonB family protein [Ruegeria intermedia]SHF37258.1 TonB family C-terminal domain-containing protein [Ruegeria intermedia]
MIPQSRIMAAALVVLAAATHAAALFEFDTDEAVLIEGGGAVAPASLGSSFRDHAAGTMAPPPAAPRHSPVAPARTAPEAPADRARAQPATRVQAQAPARRQNAHTPTLQKPQPQQARPPKPPTPSGNAAVSRKKGSVTGKAATGAASAKRTNRAAQEQGNAEASTYAGLVKRRIVRARRKSVNIRGSVRVAFRIADNGALASVSVARSSGSSRLDQVALAQVRAAAPFPPPPASARRAYTVEIVSK